MLMKDKTASSIKRKVQLAKQQVDRNFSEADKLLNFAADEANTAAQDVRDLRADFEAAKIREGTTSADLATAGDKLDVAIDKQGRVLDLIAQFEEDLEALL